MKGTVTQLSSIFPSEETRKASNRIQNVISEHEKELESLNHFIADNNNLVNLVQRIPEELHHDVMVPFGKAAFFPGRLIHTNEFLVLLGEGYYAERTSRQTIDILKRRGKSLESNVSSVKAVMQDLNAEASFFDTTAAESADGLVEIREELDEENPSEEVLKTDFSSPKASNKGVADKDDYARIMAVFDELENKELANEELANASYPNAKNDADIGNVISKQPKEDDCGISEEFSSKKHNDSSDHLNAFTGSIVERSQEQLRTDSTQQTMDSSHVLLPNSQPSKPVSRFKMSRKH